MLGGMLGSLLVPRLAEAAGYPAGFLAGAAALVVLGVVSLGLRPSRAGEPLEQPAASDTQATDLTASPGVVTREAG
jgi:hypothetical protein